MVPFRLPLEETLTIEKLVYGGEGLARVEGKVVLIPFVLPGEVVRAEIAPVKKGLFRGRVMEMLSPSPARVIPLCEYFQRCGGCQYQHIEYTEQVEQKKSILREVLRRVGKIEFDGEIRAITGKPWGYRNRVQLHAERGAVGYFEQGSRKLCAITHCPIASPALNDAISKLHVRSSEESIELFTDESEVQTNRAIEYAGFRVSRDSFFQVNRFLIDALVGCAVGRRKGDSALDLYAGVGLFARALVERFAKVTAVEAGCSAFRDLERNLDGKAEARHSTTEEFVAGLRETPGFILADPPRAGLDKGVVKELARIAAPQLTIISCDPATLARDLRGLIDARYRIDRVTLIDLFPQTFHIETVVELCLAAAE